MKALNIMDERYKSHRTYEFELLVYHLHERNKKYGHDHERRPFNDRLVRKAFADAELPMPNLRWSKERIEAHLRLHMDHALPIQAGDATWGQITTWWIFLPPT